MPRRHPYTYLYALVYALLLPTLTSANKYEPNARVEVVVNTVGPYNNPTERYMYYKKLPFCTPDETKQTKVGSALAGDRAVNSDYEVMFMRSTDAKELCTRTLEQNDIKAFRDAVKHDFTFDFFVDGLLVDGFVGEMVRIHEEFQEHQHDDIEYFLFTHWNFNIHYNGPHIIACHLQTDRSKRLPLVFGEDLPVRFTYSVTWTENKDIRYENRLEYHQQNLIRQQSLEIHWLSIINSFVLVILLVAFLALILTRILHKDYARYESVEDREDDLDEIDDSGWKQVHGDVFRPPPYPLLFSAIIGTGTQLLVLTIGVLLLALFGTFYPGNRGAVLTAIIVLYCITAGIAGHVSGKLYVQLGGTNWATNALTTACIFFVPLLFVFSILNTVAWVKNSTAALPFTTILSVFVLWAAITLPLTVYSAYRVRNSTPKLDVPCKCTYAKREIPKAPCFRSAAVQVITSGVLPFTAIYIELHYIFAAVFGHRVYTLYGILCLAFTMLIIVTAAITVSLTYFQLTIEDWRWWWRSTFSGGSTGGFVFAYAVFYFNYRSAMKGVLQTFFFFGYMIVLSYAFWLMLGAVGFWSAFVFIRHIYSQVKIE